MSRLAETLPVPVVPVQEILSNIQIDKSGCWIWTRGRTAAGYGRVGGDFYAHRVVYQAMVGEIPCGALICHHCDVPGCVNPKHLYLGSKSSNAKDAYARGLRTPTALHGAANPGAKLTADQVVAIRGTHGVGLSRIASRFGVSKNTIWRILTGKSWRSA